ncbi:hypothetical protein C8T65DRAFT_735406 [Cerioporus squamosus]|nr:hypothetical protein C8T65DRAFT_735406 [Cerioporus squamosus]
MVSPLWKACSEGSIENVVELLKEATPVDIEVKDHTGVTPLIEAVKNGHVEVVRILLDKGADPTNASSQGPPESYTSDPVVLGLLSAAKGKMGQPPAPQADGAYPQEQPVDGNHVDPATNGYYPPPPGAYYYPPMPVPPPMMPDGTVPYYAPPPHMSTDQNPSGLGNLPPPDIARMIPCRYYPACRYGSSCMFAHPQSPYMQGPPPPTQYAAPYDPMNPAPYPPTYYPVPPGSYGASPNGAHVMSPPPPMAHARSGSEVMSPVQGPFSHSAGQPPMPYGVVSPVSPTYGHPAPVPIPVSVPALPPLQTSPTSAQSPPPPAMYTPISPSAHGVAPPYAMHPQYAPPPMQPNGEVADVISPKSPVHGHPQADGYGPGPMPREMNHNRRGGPRRPSFGGRGGKPPCLFFPSGRCRNGYRRLPLPPRPSRCTGNHHTSHFSVRGGHRPRPPFHANGMATLEEKFAALTTQEVPAHSRNGTGTSTTDSSRSQSAEPGQKGRMPFKPNGFANGPRQDRRFVPSSRASSNGTTTPGYSGPTAAQVLQAPAPPRKETQTRGNTPDQLVSAPAPKAEVNGVVPEQPVNKLPLSFAAAATAVPDAPKEVSVSA